MSIAPRLLRALMWSPCLCLVGIAQAEPAAKNILAETPTRLHYLSVFASYQRYSDQAVQPWREANDRVGRIGGWRTYAKEAAAPDTPATSKPHAEHSNGAKP